MRLLALLLATVAFALAAIAAITAYRWPGDRQCADRDSLDCADAHLNEALRILRGHGATLESVRLPGDST